MYFCSGRTNFNSVPVFKDVNTLHTLLQNKGYKIPRSCKIDFIILHECEVEAT